MNEHELVLALARIEAVRFGSFRLKSGRESPFYLDLRVAVTRPELCRAMAELIAKHTKHVDYDAVVGIPYTAVPIAAHLSAITGKPLLMLRKERKDYGTGGAVVGDVNKGFRCLVVDDLITTGSSKVESVEALRAEGLEVHDIAVVVDRSQDAAAELASHGLSLHAVCGLPEMLNSLLQERAISEEQAAQITEYTRKIAGGTAGENAESTPENAAATRIRETMLRKKSNIVLSLDVSDQQQFFEVLEETRDSIAVVKTHVDIMNGSIDTFTRRLRQIAGEADLIVLEDRKFADIGNTARKQFLEGPARIADWATLVTVHMIAGETILDGLFGGPADRGAEPDHDTGSKQARQAEVRHGALLLARMSSKDNLIDAAYTQRVLEIGSRRRDEVVGYIGHAANEVDLQRFRNRIPGGQLLFVPGVHRSARGDDLGQQYMSVTSAINGGADAIIVGRGIYAAADPRTEAEAYRRDAWSAYEQRHKWTERGTR